MRRFILAVTAVSALAAALPAAAQSPAAERRWQDAQARYQAETDRYYNEREIYYSTRRRGNYAPPPPPPPLARDDYDPRSDYRAGDYQERVLAANDPVYSGSDGRYYCKRSDGTTGLVIGGAAGGVLGNVIDGGRSRTAGTLLGAAAGALLGRAAEQQNQSLRCR
jgi:hypothetical protein